MGIPGSTDFRDIWIQKTFVTSEESFPTVLRRSEIVLIDVVDISPIENALNDIQQKNGQRNRVGVQFIRFFHPGSSEDIGKQRLKHLDDHLDKSGR